MNRKLKLKIIEVFGSQAEFSTKIEEDESVISRVIRGRRKLNEGKRRAWAKALGCQIEDIFEANQHSHANNH